MGKKYFFKTSISSIVFQVIIMFAFFVNFFLMIMFIWFLIDTFNESDDALFIIFIIVVFFLGTILSIYFEFSFIIGNIVLEQDRVANYGDKRIGRDKIQYSSFVNYKEIKKIEIKPLCMKSNGDRHVALIRPIPYLCISDGKKNHRFALHFMSKKSVENLLEEIKRRCYKNGNDIEFDIATLMRKFKESKFAVSE